MSARSASVLAPGEGEIVGRPGILHDRFMITGKESQGRFALVEHLLPPRTLAAPLHRHAHEDEYSFVLEGRLGALLGEEEVFGGPGDLVFKPRGQWHTFWNAGSAPARILEMISPAGFENAFRDLAAAGDDPSPTALAALAARYGVQIDFAATEPIMQRHGLTF